MQITVWSNFSKRINSTKIPCVNGMIINVVLKETTSVENPIFILTNPNEVPTINYVKWNDHYYYVNNINMISHSQYEIECAQDLLATYKDKIQNTDAFVLYSTSDYNIGIPDTRLSSEDEVRIEMIHDESSFLYTDIKTNNDGYIFLQTATTHGTSGNGGATGNYFVKISALPFIVNNLFSADDTIQEQLIKQFGDIYKSIINCVYIPFSMPAKISGDTGYIHIGSRIEMQLPDGYSISCVTENNTRSNISTSVEIPWLYPEGDFRNLKPYSSIQLYLPFYGCYDINPDDFIGKSAIPITVVMDNCTGEIVYRIYKTESIARGRITTADIIKASCAIPITISQEQGNPLGTITSVLNSIQGGIAGGLASGAKYGAIGAVGGFLTGATSGLFNTYVASQERHLSVAGSGNGSRGLISRESGKISCVVISHDTTISPDSIASSLGRPCNAIKHLGDLSGYIQCSNASCNMDGLANDKNTVNSYLNTGFYLE